MRRSSCAALLVAGSSSTSTVPPGTTSPAAWWHTADASRIGRDDCVLHLHRAEHRHRLPVAYALAFPHIHLDDRPGHRRDQLPACHPAFGCVRRVLHVQRLAAWRACSPVRRCSPGYHSPGALRTRGSRPRHRARPAARASIAETGRRPRERRAVERRGSPRPLRGAGLSVTVWLLAPRE